MKIIVTRSTFIGGRLVEANPEPIEVSEADAKQLVALGKAVVVKLADPEPVAAETPDSAEDPAKPETAKERKAREKAEREAAEAAAGNLAEENK